MRSFLLSLFVACAALFYPAIAAAEPTKSIALHADVVDYYSNRFIVTADGNVSAQLSDGTIVRGNTFSMDLKLNRFLIAGDVHLDGPHVHEVGAAFAGYPDLDRNYFLEEGTTPDRWTYYGQEFTDTHKGRQQPGDAFLFPDLSDQKPYIISNGATIFLKNNVDFPIGARISVLGVYTPTPGFVINYSSNPNFYQNAFSGAIFDVGVPFHGAADAISALHFRYDQYRGFYTAFDQHFVHNLDYAVFSVNPITQNQRQYNAIFYKKISPATEARFFFQLSSLSNGLYEPTQASTYSNFATNARIGRYAVGLNIDQFNNTLLGNPPSPDQFNSSGLRGTGHPFDMMVNVQSFEDEIRAFRSIGVPVKFQYRGGFGYDYDGYGIPTIEGSTCCSPANPATYSTIFQKYLGLTIYTSSVRIAKQTTISAKADELVQWYSLPHHVETRDVSATIARTPNSVKQPAYYLSYEILNTGDFYGADQRNAYPAFSGPIVNQFGTFTGTEVFDGHATSHRLTGSMIFTPTPYFGLNLTMQKSDTFPRPIPGFGGQPPYQFTADVRIRISKQILVDVARSYYFNFGGQLWSPQFQVQFSP
jgi:hypothetical protein